MFIRELVKAYSRRTAKRYYLAVFWCFFSFKRFIFMDCDRTEVVGVQEITFTPHITRQGGWRATLEGVRTSASVKEDRV
jgi:hypothetical protein